MIRGIKRIGTVGWTMALAAMLFGAAGNTMAQDGGCAWLPTFGGQPGVDHDVYDLAVFDDGSGPALYAGGYFTTASGVVANRIARWDGASWSPLDTGMNATVKALAVFDDGSGPALYAGGDFSTAGDQAIYHIAKWDGATWTQLGTGMDDNVFALTVFDDGSGPALYAGGRFDTAGGEAVNFIAKWDGVSWTPLGSGMTGFGYVYALTVFDDGTGPALYAGGAFATAGGEMVNRIAKWDGTAWSPLGNGMDRSVYALAVHDDGSEPALYAGGAFTTAGGETVNHIAKWDGVAWLPLGDGLNDGVAALAVFDDGSGEALYAGGPFTTAGGAAVNHIAKWDGSSWSPLGSGLEDSVSGMAVFDDGSGPALHVGGGFVAAGGVAAGGIAKWDGDAWSPLGGDGMNDEVYALTVFDPPGPDLGSELYAGGAFTSVGGEAIQYIAKWDGAAWSSLGSGMNEGVYALTVFDDGSGPALYAGGVFTTAGSQTVNGIAKWDGASWSPLGNGVGGYHQEVLALAVFDDGTGPALYAGGGFTTAGGETVNFIAKWDGAAWSPLGSGIGNSAAEVLALAVFDDGSGPALYAGGGFGTAGGVSASNIAKWDGAAWAPVGGGIDNDVLALTVFDDGSGQALYAGGKFVAAGGETIICIAKWDGESWSPVGDGVFGHVYALTVLDPPLANQGPTLFAGGEFDTAGGEPLNYIASWDGNTWSALGSGVSGGPHPYVYALASYDDGSGDALYVGGEFHASPAGDSFLAKWRCVCLGDIDGDGDTDQSDLGLLLAHYELDDSGDLNGDGSTDQQDLGILLADYECGR